MFGNELGLRGMPFPKMPAKFNARWLAFFYAALTATLLVCLTSFVVHSWNWPFVGDAPLLHYVIFLMKQGMGPYRQIIDLNQPGTYAVEASIMRFGGGALTWRIFDLLLLGIIGAAMAAICRFQHLSLRRSPWWFPALFAAAVFALIHGRDGLIQLGQRDLLMAALLAAGYALLFGYMANGHTRGGLIFFAVCRLEQQLR